LEPQPEIDATDEFQSGDASADEDVLGDDVLGDDVLGADLDAERYGEDDNVSPSLSEYLDRAANADRGDEPATDALPQDALPQDGLPQDGLPSDALPQDADDGLTSPSGPMPTLASENQAFLQNLRQMAFDSQDTAIDTQTQSEPLAGDDMADSEVPDYLDHHPQPPQDESAESIDEYMARLLSHVSGSDQAATETSLQEAERPVSEPSDAEPATELSMTPRRVAPEHQVNMSAMRQLANFSAKSAIEKSQHTRHITAAANKGTVAVVAFVISFVMFWLADGPRSLGFLSAAAAFIAGCLWGVQAVLLFNRAHGNNVAVREAEQEREDSTALENETAAGEHDEVPVAEPEAEDAYEQSVEEATAAPAAV
jgi:hypothetical protein